MDCSGAKALVRYSWWDSHIQMIVDDNDKSIRLARDKILAIAKRSRVNVYPTDIIIEPWKRNEQNLYGNTSA